MNKIESKLLEQLTGLHSIPQGSFNIRRNGESIGRHSDAEIEIVPKTDKSGIDIIVRPNVQNRSVHIPVLVTMGNFKDLVYNDFYIGKNADITIVAGCGIHNDTSATSSHDGIHTFHIQAGAKVKYIEKHLGEGKGGGKILNPVTKIQMAKDSYFEMETLQLGGVTYSKRTTRATLQQNAKLVIKEKILTTDTQEAVTEFRIDLKGSDASVDVLSRSVAKNNSKQTFYSEVIGNNQCFAHVECDGIMLDKATIISTPKIVAKDVNATLVHEAAIGKIAGDQLIKLMTLGQTKEEAENTIIKGYLN